MEEKHRDILKSCHMALVIDLEPEMLIAHLIQERVMIPDDQEEITKIARRTRRNEEFLRILPRRGPNAYQEFVKALEENQSFLACKLLREELKVVEANCKDLESRLKGKQEELKVVEANCKDLESRLKGKQEALNESSITKPRGRKTKYIKKTKKYARENLVEETALSLPDEVLRSLLSRNIDGKDVIARLLEVLPLEQESLENPQPETKHFVRNLARNAKEMNRFDVFQCLREITPAGTTGPELPEHLEVQDVPLNRSRDVTISLSGGDEWKLVADAFGFTSDQIRFLDQRCWNPFEEVLTFICQQRRLTVGELYDLLSECGFPLIADLV